MDLPKLLVIDDHPIITNSLKRILRDWDVSGVRTAEDARATIKSAGYVATILDLGLPDDEGLR